ncbi:MAG: hypothetical protein WBF33_04520 [Candidatus Nitrosopolaris sp.]
MNHKNKRDTDLLWNCFVNWAETLEKIEGAERKILSIEEFEA